MHCAAKGLRRRSPDQNGSDSETSDGKKCADEWKGKKHVDKEKADEKEAKVRVTEKQLEWDGARDACKFPKCESGTIKDLVKGILGSQHSRAGSSHDRKQLRRSHQPRYHSRSESAGPRFPHTTMYSPRTRTPPMRR